MVTVSCYDIHYLIARLLAIWRWTQMVSDWIVFSVSMACSKCWSVLPAGSYTTGDKDTISCYKILSTHSVFLEAGEPIRRIDYGPYSDTVVMQQSRAQEDNSGDDRSTVENSEKSSIAENASIPSGHSLRTDHACGDFWSQHFLQLTPSAEREAEIEIRSQNYDAYSSFGNESVRAACGSRQELVTRTKKDLKADLRTHSVQNAVKLNPIKDQRDSKLEMNTFPELLRSQVLFQRHNTPLIQVDVSQTAPNPNSLQASSPNSKVTASTMWENQSCNNEFKPEPQQKPELENVQERSVKLKSRASTVFGSEMELESHLYNLLTRSIEDMVIVEKVQSEELNSTLSIATSSSRGSRLTDLGSNFPSIHSTRKVEEKVSRRSSQKLANISDEGRRHTS